MAEGEIERLKAEFGQQKDKEDQATSQINWRLNHKTKDLEAEHKNLMAECDQQQEKIRQLRDEVTKKTEALAEERTKAVESAKLLEEAARERTVLTGQHYEEMERAKLALNRV